MDVNTLYIIDKEFDRKVGELKRKLRLRMNGETSEQMSRRNLDYTINYGVALPHLKEIASQCSFTADECRKLWLLNIRETMLLAAMLLPTADTDVAEMLRWVRMVKTPDMAEQASFFLFSRIDALDEFCEKLLIADDEFSLSIAGFSVGRALVMRRELRRETALRIFAVVERRKGFSTVEMRAVSLFLRQMVRHKLFDINDIEKILKQIADMKDMASEQLIFEVRNEIEMML